MKPLYLCIYSILDCIEEVGYSPTPALARKLGYMWCIYKSYWMRSLDNDRFQLTMVKYINGNVNPYNG